MLKKRTLLLVAALAAFGAMMVGAVAANPQSTVPTNGSGTQYVQAPVGVAQIVDFGDGLIPAGQNVKVGDLQVSDNDSDYNVQVASATLFQGTSTCVGALWSLVYSTTPPTGDLPDFTWTDIADLMLSTSITSSSGCYSYGAYADVVFEAI